ncbi:MAG: hypothetical protein D4R68_03215 [Ignavibacteriales bacterium]|nr:MAG: hypothetical protein D4R68_03215 [Ignavibacteriales bacterium]
MDTLSSGKPYLRHITQKMLITFFSLGKLKAVFETIVMYLLFLLSPYNIFLQSGKICYSRLRVNLSLTQNKFITAINSLPNYQTHK